MEQAMKKQSAGKEPQASSDEGMIIAIKMRESDVREGPPSRAAGGSFIQEYNMALINQTLRTFWKPAGAKKDDDWSKAMQALAIYGLAGMRPGNELEGMVAAQIVAAHAAAMECYRRAAIPDQSFESRNANLNLASKASRTFATLTESLQRLRGETGKQTVHVHHHTDARTQVAANQAVVNVGVPGEGKKQKSGQPHEPKAISHDPAQPVDFSAPLRSEEPARESVPCASDEGQDAVPPSRRKESGRAGGEG